ncbi:hypothetical protein AOA60_21780, partial [Pseudomonas sp. 2822-17]
MTSVIEEMLTYGEKDQLAFTDLPIELINKTFGEAINDYQTADSFLIGIRRDNETILHPKRSSNLLKGDKLIFFNGLS